jgi:hypothetical protein
MTLLEGGSHSIITAGTVLNTVSDDHTTQLISLVTQVIALFILIFSKKKGNNANN